MKITAQDLLNLGSIDKVIPVFGGANDLTKDAIGGFLRESICTFLEKHKGVSEEEIRTERYKRLHATLNSRIIFLIIFMVNICAIFQLNL